ncbi:MAG: hypothetical protein AB1472_02430 [Candidatus Omnitrophota bacterium]
MSKPQNKKTLKGFTFVETMVVIGIFTMAFVAIIGVLISSNTTWRTGRTQQLLQQEARKAITAITNDLRESTPDLVDINNVSHPITINANGDSITFYLFNYDANEEPALTPVGVMYYLGSQNPNTQTLYRKAGASASVAVATDINNIAVEKPFFWFEPNTNNEVVNIKIPVIVNNATLSITSKVTLRNATPLVAPPAPEEPGEGEY